MLTSLMAILMSVIMVIMPYSDTKTTYTNFIGDSVYVTVEVADYQGEVKAEEKYCFTVEEYNEWLKTR